jgi:hypothetical protein
MLGVKSGPPPWKQTALEYKKSKEDATAEMPSSIEKWGTDLETGKCSYPQAFLRLTPSIIATNRLGDPSETNLSSIMFEFSNSGKRILMTGDGDGDTLYEAYNETSPDPFNIIKVCFNITLQNPSSANTPKDMSSRKLP